MATLFYSSVKHWIDVQTCVAGVVTFAPIDDQGAAVFKGILAHQYTAEMNTGLVTALPVTALKAVSDDLKTVTVNVGTGTVLGVLGATILAAPDGTKVHAHIMGT